MYVDDNEVRLNQKEALEIWISADPAQRGEILAGLMGSAMELQAHVKKARHNQNHDDVAAHLERCSKARLVCVAAAHILESAAKEDTSAKVDPDVARLEAMLDKMTELIKPSKEEERLRELLYRPYQPAPAAVMVELKELVENYMMGGERIVALAWLSQFKTKGECCRTTSALEARIAALETRSGLTNERTRLVQEAEYSGFTRNKERVSMGQYWKVFNLDKKEFLHPHRFGEGLKFLEFGFSSGGTLSALAYLLAVPSSMGSGGGDAHVSEWCGHWVEDRVILIGDYTEEAEYQEAYNSDEYKDISLLVRQELVKDI